MSWIDCVPGRTVRGESRLYLRAALDGGGRVLQAWAHDPTPGGQAPQVFAFQVEDLPPVITDLVAGGQNVVLPIGRAVGWVVFVQRTAHAYDAIVVHPDAWWGYEARGLPFPHPDGTSQGFLQWRDGAIAFTDQHHVLHPDGTTSGDIRRPRVLIRPTRTDDGVWFGQHPYEDRLCVWRASEPTVLRVVVEGMGFEPHCCIDPDGRYRLVARAPRGDHEVIWSREQFDAAPTIPLPTPPETPPTKPPVIPPEEELPVFTPDSREEDLQRIAAAYPVQFAHAHKETRPGSKIYIPEAWDWIKIAAALLHFGDELLGIAGDERVGLNGKRGGDELSMDALCVHEDPPGTTRRVVDVIVGAGAPGAKIGWNVIPLEEDGGSKWIQPRLSDVPGVEPPKEPPKDPPTTPPVDLHALAAEIRAMHVSVGELRDGVRALLERGSGDWGAAVEALKKFAQDEERPQIVAAVGAELRPLLTGVRCRFPSLRGIADSDPTPPEPTQRT